MNLKTGVSRKQSMPNFPKNEHFLSHDRYTSYYRRLKIVTIPYKRFWDQFTNSSKVGLLHKVNCWFCSIFLRYCPIFIFVTDYHEWKISFRRSGTRKYYFKTTVSVSLSIWNQYLASIKKDLKKETNFFIDDLTSFKSIHTWLIQLLLIN